jgi:hypothetical protein
MNLSGVADIAIHSTLPGRTLIQQAEIIGLLMF